MQTLLQNLRFSLRLLGRSPGLTITILLTVALGIGANTAIFTVDYATLLAPLPFPQPNQLVMVWSSIQGNRNGVAAGDFTDWKQQNTVFSDLNAWSGTSFNIATKDQPQYLQASLTTPGMLQMEGEPLFLGRYFLPEEGQAGHEHVVILTHKLWLKLGADRKIVGTTLRLDGEPYTVVGVQTAGDQDRGQNQLTVPLVFKPEQLNHDFHWLLVMGRMKPGVTLQQAQQNMTGVTAHIAQVYPKSDKGWGAKIEPLKNDFLPPERIQMLWLLLGAVGFVLLIACVNVANLLLARGMVRQKELAVRSALGAARATIFAQLLTECLLLALAGGVLGVGLGYAMLQGLIAVMPRGTLPNEANLQLNIPILLFALAATTLAGLLAGCAPAWYASRVDPGETLKEGGRTGTSVGKHRLRRILVTAEFGLALALLAGAGLAIHSFWNLTQVDLGIRTDHVLAFSLPVPDSRSKDPVQITAYYRDILAHINAVPGVSHAAVMTGYPLYGGGFGMPFTLAGGPAYSDPSQRPGSGFGMVTPDYFSDLRHSYRERTAVQRTGHRRHHKGRHGKRVVRQKISAGERSAAPARGGGGAHSRRAKTRASGGVADCRGVSRRPCRRPSRPSGGDAGSLLADPVAAGDLCRPHGARSRFHAGQHCGGGACGRCADCAGRTEDSGSGTRGITGQRAVHTDPIRQLRRGGVVSGHTGYLWRGGVFRSPALP